MGDSFLSRFRFLTGDKPLAVPVDDLCGAVTGVVADCNVCGVVTGAVADCSENPDLCAVVTGAVGGSENPDLCAVVAGAVGSCGEDWNPNLCANCDTADNMFFNSWYVESVLFCPPK